MKRTSLPTLIRAEWDRILASVLIAAGAVLVLVAWAGVSGTPFVADQLAYIASGGIGGLFLLALGLALLMSADHHDEWRKLDAIEAALRETRPDAGLPPAARRSTPARWRRAAAADCRFCRWEAPSPPSSFSSAGRMRRGAGGGA